MARFSATKRFLLLAPFLVVALLFVFRSAALAGIGNFQVVRDKLEAADPIFILNGDITVRPIHAAKLFHPGCQNEYIKLLYYHLKY